MELNFTDLIWIIPLFVLMLSVLVFVHELGHFAAARFFKISVEEFAIGFPPRAFSIKRGGIEYSINWLPLGGYVKIVGENNDSDDPHSFGKAKAWQRMVVLAAGPIMNLILSLIIFMGLSMSGIQEPDAPLTGVSTVMAGAPAANGGMLPGDRIISVAGVEVSDNDQLRTLSKQHADKPTAFVVDRNGELVTLTITPSSTNAVPLGVGLSYWVSPAVVDEVYANSSAEKAGLKVGDEIVEVNGAKVTNVVAAGVLLTGEKTTAQVTVRRGGETVGPLTVEINDKNRLPGMAFYFPQHTIHYNPPDAMGRALNNTWGVVSALPAGIKDAVSGQAQGPGVTGPLGIAQLYAEVAQRLGLSGILNLTALLGISLFMINLLPLPALDGGRLLFIFIEVLRGGRRISPEKEGMAHMVGMVALLVLMLIITIFDAQRLWQGGALLP